MFKWYRLFEYVTISLGWLLLVGHFVFHPEDLHFEPRWIAAYMAFQTLIPASGLLLTILLNRLGLLKGFIPLKARTDDALKISKALRDKLWLWLTIPSEDGLHFVWVLYAGINVWTAAISSEIFGALHWQYNANWKIAIVALTAFVQVLVVLPHGILNMVIGHLLIDLLGFTLILVGASALQHAEARRRASTSQE